jgi:hypothetical protein
LDEAARHSPSGESPSDASPADASVIANGATSGDTADAPGDTAEADEPPAPWARVLDACLEYCPDLLAEFDQTIRELRRDLKQAQRYDRLRAERTRLARQMPEGTDFGGMIRYENMLDRQWHRSLRELRALQAERRKLEQAGD